MNDRSDLVNVKQTTFHLLDHMRQMSESGVEYWLARDLQKLLEYAKWSDFRNVIEKAMMACDAAGGRQENHFARVRKMVTIGSNAERPVEDVALTRYACYLAAMNGDPSKPVIAAAQAYFAVQTRKQELAEQHDELETRLALRDKVKVSNKDLNSTAKNVGVQNYALFHDAGYRGLYDDLGVAQIKDRKGIPVKEDWLDRIGNQELAANYFRITQAEASLKREPVNGDLAARQVHREVGQEVRNTIKKLGGTMPEDLPAEPSLKSLARARKTPRKLLRGKP